MIFTECTENNKIIFTEADAKNKLTQDRTELLRTATRFVKSEIGSTIEPYTTFRIDKDYSKNDFINGKCEFVTVAHIRKSAEPYIGTQVENAKAILDILNRVCDKVNVKLPDGCKVISKYKGDPNSEEEWDGWDINLTVPQGKKEFLKESHTGGGSMSNQILAFSGNNGGSYMHDAIYESYVQSKIAAENRLAFALKESMIISESDYSNITALQEAKIGDKIKVTWKKFIAFIKGIFAKFMESITNILLDEKTYLEKYKDIILKKKPKDDMEYSYTGNYTKGINRLTNTQVPMFDYYKYRKQLDAEGDGELVRAIMSGSDFSYDDGETLAEQFKGYFLALEDGQQEGKFSNLNMTDIYNFCYNFNKVKDIVNKDISRLEASTRAIESAINRELGSTEATPETDKPADTSTTTTEESAILNEAEEAKNTGLKISSDPTSKMGSTQNRDENAEKDAASAGASVAKDNNKESSDISKAADKWISVCRPLIAAKMTACQQIAKDYMAIIRAHVRSYGGSDKKEGNKSPDKGTKYSNNPDVAKAKNDAEKAAKDAQ